MALAQVHMEYTLQSWDLIVDQVETAAGSHHLDGMVVVPGCNKNMPGVLMARQCFSIFPISSIGTSIHVYSNWIIVGCLNHPSLMVYRGSIQAGS